MSSTRSRWPRSRSSASTSRSRGSRSACWIATVLLIAFLVAAVRKPQIVPGKLQFLGESGYSLVRDGIARDVVGPKGLPFAPFLASLFFFILANNLIGDHPVRADLADVAVALPARARR